MAHPIGPPGRIAHLDIARSLALLAMAAYHLSYDLRSFGLYSPGPAESVALYWAARVIAGSFLAMAGLSLWLAHGAAFRARAFWWRWGQIAAGAVAVSAGTYAMLGPYFVFFGILHAMALFSLMGLLFLRAPVWATLGVAGAVLALPYVWHPALMDAPALRFLGLHSTPVFTVDFEPVFPWFAPFLLGIALGRWGARRGLWAHLAARPVGRAARAFGWPGRHSLILYLLHQPILIGLITAVLWLMSR